MALPALLFASANVLATILSVTPLISLFGSYNRVQGLYTILSYLVIFFVVTNHVRTRAQLERAIDAIILVSLPVALYGMIQWAGLDPLPWSGDLSERVAGTLGNPIFLAAYLIMAVPLTLVRGFQRLERLVEETAAPRKMLWSAAAVILLVLLGLGIWRFTAFGVIAVLLLVGTSLVARLGRVPLLDLLPLAGYGIILSWPRNFWPSALRRAVDRGWG